jgi:hypothetical protein
MRQIELLVEAYLMAERDLVAVVDAAGGTVPLPDGRTVTVGRAEFDTLLDRPRKRAWVARGPVWLDSASDRWSSASNWTTEVFR